VEVEGAGAGFVYITIVDGFFIVENVDILGRAVGLRVKEETEGSTVRLAVVWARHIVTMMKRVKSNFPFMLN